LILVTGAAGFIGFHVSKELLLQGQEVIGIDSINEYYDPSLKQKRLQILEKEKNFNFEKLDMCDYDRLTAIFAKYSNVLSLSTYPLSVNIPQ
jgi:UDP-glucuronate 4-epimerase